MTKAKTSYKKESGVSDKYVKGMNLSQIENHLQNLKTDSGKIGYLKKISERKGLLDARAKTFVYNKLGEFERKEGNFLKAAEHYEKDGMKDEASNCYVDFGDEEFKKGNYREADKFYKKGMTEFQIKYHIAEQYEKRGDLYDAEYILEEAAKECEKKGDSGEAISFYEKLGSILEKRKIQNADRLNKIANRKI